MNKKICQYLMGNIKNCKYKHWVNDDINLLSFNSVEHQVSNMFGDDGEMCKDYWLVKDNAYGIH
jgi:hypothetical protein